MTLDEFILARPRMKASAIVAELNHKPLVTVEDQESSEPKPEDQRRLEKRILIATEEDTPITREEVIRLGMMGASLRDFGLALNRSDLHETHHQVTRKVKTFGPSAADSILGRPATIRDVKAVRTAR